MNRKSLVLAIFFISLFIVPIFLCAQVGPSRSGNPAPQENAFNLRQFPCAGETIIEENFEDQGLPSGWQILDFDGLTPNENIADRVGPGWQSIQDFKNPLNRAFASPAWYQDTSARSEDWLISPQISVSGNTCLSWYAYSQDTDFAEDYEVRVSTSGTDTADFLANDALLFVFGEDYQLNYRSLDISQFDGQDIYLAFRHTSMDKFVLVLDDVRVSTVQTFDLSPLDIRLVEVPDSTDLYQVKGAIRNRGSEALEDETGILVSYSFDGRATQTILLDTFDLAPNDTLQFAHDSLRLLPITGVFEICVWVHGRTDDDISNDTTCDDFGLFATNINDHIKEGFELFPNPSQNHIQYRWKNAGVPESYQVAILDMLGKRIWEDQRQRKETDQIDIESLPSGVYFLSIQMDDAPPLVKKFIKN